MNLKVETNSSQITKIEYDGRDLTITFKNKDKWVYEDVPELEVTQLIQAESKGSYFYKNIKLKYNATKI